MLDEEGNEYVVFSGKTYYNQTHAARYVGITDTGFRKKIKKIEVEKEIVVPRVTLPHSAQNKYIDKRVLDVFKKSVKVGHEQKWYDELRRVVDLVDSED